MIASSRGPASLRQATDRSGVVHYDRGRRSVLPSCWSSGAPGASASSTRSGVINAVGAENEYANVLSQIGGRYVKVSSILNNPNTDPHTFEASTSVARR